MCFSFVVFEKGSFRVTCLEVYLLKGGRLI